MIHKLQKWCRDHPNLCRFVVAFFALLLITHFWDDDVVPSAKDQWLKRFVNRLDDRNLMYEAIDMN
jgi:hypothetical protein